MKDIGPGARVPSVPLIRHWCQYVLHTVIPVFVGTSNCLIARIEGQLVSKSTRTHSTVLNIWYTHFLLKAYIWGFPKLNVSQIELIEPIELIWMTLGTVKINSCVTSKLSIIKKKCLLYCTKKRNVYVIPLQCVVSLIKFLLLLVIIIYCMVKIGLVTENSILNYLPIIVFQITVIQLA